MIDIAVVVGIVVALTQILKPFVKKNLLPVLSLVLGVVAGIFLFNDVDLTTRILYGVAIGLGASGTFDVSKVVTKR
jgi:hypothetical protein